MATQQRSGKPWSGTNKIPTISQFIDNLDKDKKERDKQVTTGGTGNVEVRNQDVMPHKNQERMKNAKEVSDPVTGRQVKISDVGEEYMDNALNPKVSYHETWILCMNIDDLADLSTEPEPGQRHHRRPRPVNEEPRI